MLNTRRVFTPLALAAVLLWAAPARATTIHLTDFIPDGSRSQFNSFELIGNDGTYYTGGSGPYTEDGITVQQVLGDSGNSIWLTAFHPDGAFGWYPDGGDGGYTVITRAGGVDFVDVGFFRGSGFYDAPVTLHWELWDDGALVLSGSVAGLPLLAPQYLGFGGGGFDEIRLRDTQPNWPGLNAFAVDAIELRNGVPEPGSSLLLFGIALAGLRAARKRLS